MNGPPPVPPEPVEGRPAPPPEGLTSTSSVRTGSETLGIVLRDALATELPAIIALLADDEKGRVRETAGDRGYIAAFDAIAADANQRLIVATLDDQIVGTMQLSFLPGLSFRGAWRLQIEAVRVASRLRGGGIGAQMIGWAVEQARERGCRMVQSTSHRDRTNAHRFYDQLGFTQSHVGYKLAL